MQIYIYIIYDLLTYLLCHVQPGFWGCNKLWCEWEGCFLCPKNSSPKAKEPDGYTDANALCSCNAGFYMDYVGMGYDCLMCPSNSVWLPEGNGGRDDEWNLVLKWCACKAGYVMTETWPDPYAWQPTWACEACPELSTSVQGSNSFESCTCDLGYWRDTTYNPRSKCAECPDTKLTGETCRCAGYYKTDGFESECQPCPVNSHSKGDEYDNALSACKCLVKSNLFFMQKK